MNTNQNVSIADVVKTQTLLMELAGAIESELFSQWLENWKSVYGWAGPKLVERLNGDLIASFAYALKMDHAKPEQILLALATKLRTAAKTLHTAYGNGETQQEPAERKAPAANVFSAELHRMASQLSECWPLIADVDTQYTLRAALAAYEEYTTARFLIQYGTLNKRFEEVLNSVTEQYLVEGNPLELLSDCHHALRSGEPVAAIALYDRYCRADWVTLEELKEGVGSGMLVTLHIIDAEAVEELASEER